VPALVLVGSETSEAFKASAEIVAGALPHAHVEILEGQAHGADNFAPELVAVLVGGVGSGTYWPRALAARMPGTCRQEGSAARRV